MTDEVQIDAPVVETPAEPVMPDFANHSVYADFKAHIDEFGKEASARLHQLLEEARQLFNL